MRICLDSNQFIFGISGADPNSETLLLGLREKADAWIGAFTEWQEAKYLISDNRHFLSDLAGDAFEVLDPAEFLQRYTSVRQ